MAQTLGKYFQARLLFIFLLILLSQYKVVTFSKCKCYVKLIMISIILVEIPPFHTF